MKNIDNKTVAGFGREWSTFDQRQIAKKDLKSFFDEYFLIFPWEKLPTNPIAADIGCGSGRWALFVAPKVLTLHMVDASLDALKVAESNLSHYANVVFHHASLSELPFEDNSLDFAYSLGVLHHIPDTLQGIKDIARKIKPNGLFLAYIYYNFENRPPLFRLLWQLSDIARKIISALPFAVQKYTTLIIALLIYFPLTRFALLLEKLNILPHWFPLKNYRSKPFYSMKTDAFDRFATRLEKRFSKREIMEMFVTAGFKNIFFSETEPYWCVVAEKH